jgi:hypothetical protein
VEAAMALLKTQAAMEETRMAARIRASLIATAGYVRAGNTHRQLQNRLTTGMPTLRVVNLVVLIVGLQLTDLILYFRAQ